MLHFSDDLQTQKFKVAVRDAAHDNFEQIFRKPLPADSDARLMDALDDMLKTSRRKIQ